MHWFMISSSMAQGIAQFVKIAPPAMRRFFFEDNFGFTTVQSLLSLAYTHPFILFLFIAYPALFFHREICSAQEKGILALTLSKPISRASYLVNLIISSLLNIIALGFAAAAGVILSYYIYNTAGGALTNFMLAIINLVLLALFLGGLALLIAVCATNSGQATGWMIGLPLALYLLEFLGKSMKQIAFLSPFNPFHYFNPQKVLYEGKISYEDAGFLMGGAIVLSGLSFFSFRRKDV